MRDIQWNRITVDEYVFLCQPDDQEMAVLSCWAAGESVAYTAYQTHMSDSSVEKIRARIRQKYDAVQPYTPLLPERPGR